MKNVTVIIPAHNEEQSIVRVIENVKKENIVDEVIVVANSCTDNTKRVSLQSGAKVVVCNKKGKGYAMEAGLKKARNEFIVFLDADINGYKKNIVRILAKPIVNGKADFVKSTFTRTVGGTVTEIVAKPLLDILFPSMYKYSEPLSGMIAVKKSLLKSLDIEKDYGVDIGITIDMFKIGAIAQEVHIGEIENLSHLCKTEDIKKKMSYEVMAAVLKRSNRLDYVDNKQLFNLVEIAI